MYQSVQAVNIHPPPGGSRGFAHPSCPAPGLSPKNFCPGGPGLRSDQTFQKSIKFQCTFLLLVNVFKRLLGVAEKKTLVVLHSN